MEKYKIFRGIFIGLMSAFLALTFFYYLPLEHSGWATHDTRMTMLAIDIVLSSIAMGNAALWWIYERRSRGVT